MSVCRRVLIVFAFALALSRTASAQTSDPSPERLLSMLKAGGYTLHFRHATTDFSQADRDTSAGSSCSSQRNLSAEGRKQASDIGAAIRALNIRIDEVRAGPLCRTQETARLMFGPDVKIDPDVRGGGLSQRDYPGLRRLIATPVAGGGNVVLVGHGHQFAAVVGAGAEIGEADAAIVKGAGEGRFTVVAVVKSGDWQKMLRSVTQ